MCVPTARHWVRRRHNTSNTQDTQDSRKTKNRSGSRRWWNSARSCTWQLEGATPRWFGMRTRSIPKTAYNEKHLFFRFSPS